MAHQTLRVDLSSVIYPFTKDLWGRSIIVPQYDENYQRGIYTYIYYAATGCLRYDQTTKLMVPVTLIGLDPTQVLGITSSFGYMIAWSATTIAWSSTLNPLDFTPSLVTGAGGGNINDISGSIVMCVPISGGFLVFCEKNVVSAKYTGNIRFPFIFKELANAGGIETQDQISTGSGTGDIYAWTSVGLQKLSLTLCEDVFPEATDFLAKLIFEDFDEVTLSFTETALGSPLNIRLSFIAQRFLVISYGTTLPTYTHAIVYDEAFKRWGKIKWPHRDVFQWNAPNLFGSITYDHKMITHQWSDVENIKQGDPFALYLVTSLDGKSLQTPILATRNRNGSLSQRWAKRITGQNYSLLAIGAFNLTSILTDFTLGGDR